MYYSTLIIFKNKFGVSISCRPQSSKSEEVNIYNASVCVKWISISLNTDDRWWYSYAFRCLSVMRLRFWLRFSAQISFCWDDCDNEAQRRAAQLCVNINRFGFNVKDRFDDRCAIQDIQMLHPHRVFRSGWTGLFELYRLMDTTLPHQEGRRSGFL